MLCIHPIPAFNDNYIWLISTTAGDQAFVVDPGDAAVVEQALEERKLQLAGILITHHHFDHVGGLADLKAKHNPVVYGPDNPAIQGLDHIVRDGDVIKVLGTSLKVLEVPGHTLDHIAYFKDGEEPLVFCGDTLFAGGCGRVFEGTPDMMHASLRLLAELPGETRIYCAHEYTLANLEFAQAVEPNNDSLARRVIADQASRAAGVPTVPSTLSLELATNPFVRCETRELQESLRQQNKLVSDAPVAVFATVRGWKDTF